MPSTLIYEWVSNLCAESGFRKYKDAFRCHDGVACRGSVSFAV